MLMVVKSAREMLTKLSYKGFEIRDDKDLLKCLLSVFSDYLGSILHDKDNQQETIFHHLAQSIPYTLEGKSKQVLGKDGMHDNPDNTEADERCQSSVSTAKLAETQNECKVTSFEELAISFDLTSLSYNFSIFGTSSHVIFLETRSIYPLSTDILCKYIHYRTNHESTSNLESNRLINHENENNHDRIEIHPFTESIERSHHLQSESLVFSFQVLDHQSVHPSQALLKSLLIPKSNLNVETGQRYCFVYLDSNRSILGRSGPFQFSPLNQINELYNGSDSDDDGFVIVDS